MKHLLTENVVSSAFALLYDCMKAGKTITLKELTDGINQTVKKAGVNELVIASLLNTVYTHPANEYTHILQKYLKFTKAELSAMTVVCFECGQDVYPRWLVIGNKSDCANLMRDRNNTLVLMRARHLTKSPLAESVSVKEMLGANTTVQLHETEESFQRGEKKTNPSSLANAIDVTEVILPVGHKLETPQKLVSALELRTAPMGNKYHEAQTAPGKIPDVKRTVCLDMVPSENIDAVAEEDINLNYSSTGDCVLLGDYRNLTLELTKAAIFHQPVTFNHLRNAIDVSKGRLSDMLLNIVETLPDTMHAGLLRNLLSFIEKPNGDVPHWWTKANNGATEEEVHQMRKYVANGLSGQWTQLIKAHNIRDRKTNEQLAIKYQLVEQSVKMGLVSKLLAENASQFDIQNLMQFNKFGWEHTGNFVWTVFTAEAIGQIEIFIWDNPIDDEVQAVVDNSPHGVALRNNAYIPYRHAESFNWYYRSFPVPHSIHVVPNT